MSETVRPRLLLLRVLVLSLLITLFGRLWYLQVLAGEKYISAAQDNRIREVITPAARGDILDGMGTPLARNRTAIVVTVNRTTLQQQKDGGKAVLGRVARLIDMPYSELHDRIQPCGPKAPKNCWTGSPQQPVPVATYSLTDTTAKRKVLAVQEHREDFPGVEADLKAVREYPKKSLAAHVLGYVGPVNGDELKSKAFKGVHDTDLIGKDGLERVYNEVLGGRDGVLQLAVDRHEKVTDTIGEQPAQSGGNLVLSLDAKVQDVAEKALTHWLQDARRRTDRDGKHFKAPAGAAVVLEASTGRVVALADEPTYDLNLWIPGIPLKTYQQLQKKGALYPQATQGLYAPGSTFKIVTTSAVVQEGRASLTDSYACPSFYQFGTGKFSNFEGEALGSINLRTALIKSCDTIFYRFAAQDWLEDGGLNAVSKPKESIAKMARSFGFGSHTGIDLPSESEGRIADRAYKQALWKQLKDDWCKGQYTNSDPYIRALDAENCKDGYQFRGGDAIIQSVGQGETVVTPLQLAVAYAALANGGTIYEPQLAKAVLAPDGKVVKTYQPQVKGHLPVDPGILAYVREALSQVPVSGTGAYAFAGFPLGRTPVAGKTGTAEVANKQDTSWFASFAPADHPRFVVVGMMAEAGQGGLGAARMVREIYDGIYGYSGKKAALPGGELPTALPSMDSDGTVIAPTRSPAPTRSSAALGMEPALAPDRRTPSVWRGGA